MKEIDPNLPIDKVAARVVSPNGEALTEFKVGDHISSMVRLPTLQYKGNPKNDLTGKQFGRFTVIGIWMLRPYRKTGTNTGARWVVRCRCGRYEVRSTKGLKKENVNAKCSQCKRNWIAEEREGENG